MDQAVRAPAIMQDIIAPSSQSDHHQPQQRYQPGTISEIHEDKPTIELSEDEVVEGLNVEDEAMEVTDSVQHTVKETTKVTRRRKKAPVDLTFSSGGESDGDLDLSPTTSRGARATAKTATRKTSARTASSRSRKTKQ